MDLVSTYTRLGRADVAGIEGYKAWQSAHPRPTLDELDGDQLVGRRVPHELGDSKVAAAQVADLLVGEVCVVAAWL